MNDFEATVRAEITNLLRLCRATPDRPEWPETTIAAITARHETILAAAKTAEPASERAQTATGAISAPGVKAGKDAAPVKRPRASQSRARTTR